jgi:hypothetical protein
MLGQALRLDFERNGSSTQLELGLQFMRDGLESAPQPDRQRNQRLLILAQALLIAVDLMLDEPQSSLVAAHLNLAERWLVEALYADRDRLDDRALTEGQSTLGHCKLLRYVALSEDSAIWPAIDNLSQSADRAHPLDRAPLAANLARAYMTLWDDTGDFVWLAGARMLYRRAVAEACTEAEVHKLQYQRSLKVQDSPEVRGDTTRHLPGEITVYAAKLREELARDVASEGEAPEFRLGVTGSEPRVSFYWKEIQWALKDGEEAERNCRWEDAATAYANGQAMERQLYGAETSREAGLWQLAKSFEISSRLGYVLGRAGRTTDAIKALEAGRARYLSGRSHLHELEDFETLERLFDGDAGRLSAGVYLCCSVTGGLAILLGSGAREAPSVVLLPEAGQTSLRLHSVGLIAALDSVLDTPNSALQKVDDACRWSWDAIMGPILEEITLCTDEIAIVACSWFALLPLHAAWTPDPSGPTGRRYVSDDVALCTAPNLRVVAALHERSSRKAASRVLVVADPEPSGFDPLPNARREAEIVKTLWPEASLAIGSDADREHLEAELSRCQLIHFATHGVLQVDDPLRSGIFLANDDLITAAEMQRWSLDCAPIITLSACETTGIGRAAPDEIVGLPAALLQAGARGVFGSMWAVTDDCAALLVGFLYECLGVQGVSPARALAEAQRRVREITVHDLNLRHVDPIDFAVLPGSARPYEHPWYWAAFQYVGPPHGAPLTR